MTITVKCKRNKKVVFLSASPKDTLDSLRNELISALKEVGGAGTGEGDMDMDIDIPIPSTEFETTTSADTKTEENTEIGEIRLALGDGDVWVEVENYNTKIGDTDLSRDYGSVAWAGEGEDFVVL